jgi:hypothetical protein
MTASQPSALISEDQGGSLEGATHVVVRKGSGGTAPRNYPRVSKISDVRTLAHECVSWIEGRLTISF